MPPRPDALQAIVDRVAARARGVREGLFGADSMVWTIARENVLFAGAPRALLMQLAHPAVVSGVAQHSHVRSDPLGRSVRTFEAMYALSFGDLDAAMGVIRGVWRRHQPVRGAVTSETRSPDAGAPYRATDPRLLLWVWATLQDTMVRTFETFVRPLSVDERARFHEEAKVMQLAFGMTEQGMPPTVADFDAYVTAMVDGPQLDVTREAREQWEILLRQPPSTALIGALMLPQRRALSAIIDGSPVRLLAPTAARVLAAGTLPPRLRESYGLRWSRSEAALFGILVEATRRGVAHLPRHLRHHAAYRRAMQRIARSAA